jgi:hypothetical protein
MQCRLQIEFNELKMIAEGGEGTIYDYKGRFMNGR